MEQRKGVRQPGMGRARVRGHLARQILLVTAALLSLALAAGAALGFGFLVWADQKFRVSEVPGPVLTAVDTTCDPVCNYLILGSDTRLGLSPEEQALHGDEATVPGQRADTIILVHIDPDREKAVVVHFPRDLWVEIPGVGYAKINSAFQGGPNLMVQTIEGLTGIEINHYVGITLAGFEDTVDALGHVRICVDRPMFDEYANLNLPQAGCYDMNGKTALAFVRARHVEGDCVPDFARISRQQQFLRAVMGRLLSPSVVPHLPSLISRTVVNLPHDEDLKLPDLLALANALKGIETGAVDFRAVPGTVGSEGELSVVHLDPEADVLFRRLRGGTPLGEIGKQLAGTQLSPANVRVRVFNARSGGKAGKVEGFLRGAGFESYPLSDQPPAGVTGSVILYRSGREGAAEVVRRFLPVLEVQEAPEGLLAVVDVAVVIDAAYAGPGLGATTPSPGASPVPPPPESGCG